LDDDLTPSTERVDASGVVRLGVGPETVYVCDTAYFRDVVKIGCTVIPAIDRIVQQIATGMPGKPRLLVELKTENARTLERAIYATLAWRGHKVEGGGNEWFAVSPETVIEVARMIHEQVNMSEHFIRIRHSPKGWLRRQTKAHLVELQRAVWVDVQAPGALA
jgi:hypothetical protein